MNFYPKPTKLVDCQQHGADSELLIVEGDSASRSVQRVRSPENQAVLPMQGKPLNAYKASRTNVLKNELFQVLIRSLNTGIDDEFDLSELRYQRIVLLFDPDADGIHCGALMLMFFYRWMPTILDERRLHVIHPPLYEFTAEQSDDKVHAYNENHFSKIRDQLEKQNIKYKSKRFRGLASIGEQTLRSTCVEPQTRRSYILQQDDAIAAINTFGGKPK